MNNLKEYSDKISEEVTAVLSRVDLEQMNTFLDLIQGARRIALYGGGREGLMIRALAMRLFHLGFEVSVVGDMTAPFLTNGDLLILSVGPGYVSTVDALRSVAQHSRMEGPRAQPIKSCIYPRRRWQTISRARPLLSCQWGASTNWRFSFLTRLLSWNCSS